MTAADLRSNTTKWDEELAAGREVVFQMSPRMFLITWVILLIAGLAGIAQALNLADEPDWVQAAIIMIVYTVLITGSTWLIWSIVARPIVLHPDGVGTGRGPMIPWADIEAVSFETVHGHQLVSLATRTADDSILLPADTGVDGEALTAWLRKKIR